MLYSNKRARFLATSFAFACAAVIPCVGKEAASTVNIKGTASVDTFLQPAEVKFKAHDYQGTIAELDVVSRSHPASARAYYLRACCEHMLKDYAGSVADCTKAITLDPTHSAHIYYQRGMSEYRQEDLKASIEDSSAAIRMEPKFPPSYWFRALARAQSEEFVGALADCTAYLKLCPTDGRALDLRRHLEDQVKTISKEDREIEEGALSVEELPKIKTEHKPYTVHYGEYGLQLIPPTGWDMQEGPSPDGKTVSFTGPKQFDQSSPVLDVCIFAPKDSNECPPQAEMLGLVLDPYRKHLAFYSEKEIGPLSINGHSFEAVTFSGNVGFIFPTKGNVYITKIKDAFVIITDQNSPWFFDQSHRLAMQALESIKIFGDTNRSVPVGKTNMAVR